MAFSLDSQKWLPYKLGAWKTTITTLNRWYFTSGDQQLWHHTTEGWRVHSKIPNRSRTARFHSHYQESTSGPDSEPRLCIMMVKGYHHILMQLGGHMQHTDPADGLATNSSRVLNFGGTGSGR